MQTFIYVIAADTDGPVKIGFSKNPDKRLRQLQTGFPETLVLHHVQPFEPGRAKLVEKLIHKAVAYKRTKGEWFAISVEDAVCEIAFAQIRYDEHPICVPAYDYK
jgi:hypothetical protein